MGWSHTQYTRSMASIKTTRLQKPSQKKNSTPENRLCARTRTHKLYSAVIQLWGRENPGARYQCVTVFVRLATWMLSATAGLFLADQPSTRIWTECFIAAGKRRRRRWKEQLWWKPSHVAEVFLCQRRWGGWRRKNEEEEWGMGCSASRPCIIEKGWGCWGGERTSGVGGDGAVCRGGGAWGGDSIKLHKDWMHF